MKKWFYFLRKFVVVLFTGLGMLILLGMLVWFWVGVFYENQSWFFHFAAQNVMVLLIPVNFYFLVRIFVPNFVLLGCFFRKVGSNE